MNFNLWIRPDTYILPSPELYDQAAYFFRTAPDIRRILEAELCGYLELKLKTPALELQKPSTHLSLAYIDGCITTISSLLSGEFTSSPQATIKSEE